MKQVIPVFCISFSVPCDGGQLARRSRKKAIEQLSTAAKEQRSRLEYDGQNFSGSCVAGPA